MSETTDYQKFFTCLKKFWEEIGEKLFLSHKNLNLLAKQSNYESLKFILAVVLYMVTYLKLKNR